MKIGTLISGFRVVSGRESKELCGTLWELAHEKSGARLFWLDNGEENKVFSAAFRTPPWDDTGVFHILEHSVLCGSERYPVKEPFLDLLKGSMQTFLNAFTFSDKTMYPVASRNEQDFLNLTGVYLDAVFQPMLLKNPGIFLQEGTRIDFDAETPAFNGVVYNEMKGATASLSTQVYNEMNRLLFPDTPYGYISGGDPASIPKLTYEAFTEAYKTYYHPSNCILYLDGAVPVDRVLPLIDGYLRQYEKSGGAHPIAFQPPIDPVRVKKSYEIGESEPTEKKTCIAFGKQICDYTDRKKLGALHVLDCCLFDTNESPMKRAVLESGLAEDVSLWVIDGVLQPFTVLMLRNTEEAHRDRLAEILQKTAREVVEKGIDPESISAELDRMELQYRIPEEPQGVWRAVDMLSGLLYGGDALLYLENSAVIASLRAEIGTSYYTDLVRELFLENDHTAELTLTPDPALGQKRTAAEQALLEQTLSQMTPAARAEAEARYQAFQAWQASTDSEEAKAAIPRLSVKDLAQSPAPYQTEIKTQNGAAVWFHPRGAKGVVYTALYFNASDLLPEELPALAFLTSLFNELPTARHSVIELQRERKRLTGACYADTLVLPGKTPEEARVYFTMDYSALAEKVPQAAALAAEILTSTQFTDAGKVKEIVTQTKDRLYRSICAAGNRYAGTRALAANNGQSAALDLIEGLGFYSWIKDFEEHFEDRIGPFFAFAKKTAQTLFVGSRLTLTETADAFCESAFGQIAAFPAGEGAAQDMRFTLDAPGRAEAIVIPGGSSFAALGADLRRIGERHAGGMYVLSSMLTFGYLWDEIRVRGGAYGCNCRLTQDHTLALTSYRDPTPVRSLDVFRAAPAFLENGADPAGIEQYIVSTVAEADPLRAPGAWGKAADRQLLLGRTHADRVKEYREMLEVTAESLRAYASLLSRAEEAAAVCVIGSREALTGPDSAFTPEQIREL